ncbi:hypothetical protein AVEN_227372-1 [Araneus ventricosus]|uniref:Uncharacterized protein n=1 Tax=Araneus ventricosus TaxID=182803 RepID=A0A4Y2GSC6_ARAVE|nr:hypothetical protein AVEN_227372-1 [Araneus ventricosus]
MTTLSSIGYVAHVHFFRRMCPREIGVVQVLPLGIPDKERKTLLVTVNNSDLKMHLADWRANVVVRIKFLSYLQILSESTPEQKQNSESGTLFQEGRSSMSRGWRKRVTFEDSGCTSWS